MGQLVIHSHNAQKQISYSVTLPNNRDMKSIFLFVFVFMCSNDLWAQNEQKQALDFGDVFVIRVEI